jgi:tetratricopeptide (TPR) repeat protein
VGVILVNVGRSYLALDQPSLAMPHLHAGLRITRRTDNRPVESAVLTALGDAHRALGEPGLAEGCYRQALHLARSLDDARREAQIQHAMAELNAEEIPMLSHTIQARKRLLR